MPVPAPKGLALTGSILAIVMGGLMVIGAIFFFIEGRRDEAIIIGSIAGLIGITAIVLGSIGCTIKAGVILANAIVFSVVTLLGVIGVAASRAQPVMIISLLLYVTTTTFLWVGFAQALKYKAAQRDEG